MSNFSWFKSAPMLDLFVRGDDGVVDMNRLEFVVGLLGDVNKTHFVNFVNSCPEFWLLDSKLVKSAVMRDGEFIYFNINVDCDNVAVFSEFADEELLRFAPHVGILGAKALIDRFNIDSFDQIVDTCSLFSNKFFNTEFVTYLFNYSVEKGLLTGFASLRSLLNFSDFATLRIDTLNDFFVSVLRLSETWPGLGKDSDDFSWCVNFLVRLLNYRGIAENVFAEFVLWLEKHDTALNSEQVKYSMVRKSVDLVLAGYQDFYSQLHTRVSFNSSSSVDLAEACLRVMNFSDLPNVFDEEWKNVWTLFNLLGDGSFDQFLSRFTDREWEVFSDKSFVSSISSYQEVRLVNYLCNVDELTFVQSKFLNYFETSSMQKVLFTKMAMCHARDKLVFFGAKTDFISQVFSVLRVIEKDFGSAGMKVADSFITSSTMPFSSLYDLVHETLQ